MAKNKVIAGYMNGESVGITMDDVMIGNKRFAKWTISSYETVDDEHRKSILSGVIRGAIGKVVLGPVGMVAGALSAKSVGTYTVSVSWKDGTRSLVEVDDKIYKAMVKAAY